ncbi:hypothetical protein HID58_025257 [Brassica napus]|uniref:Uncharacterized protein n=2 Tax=Brassica TaxID=3705 RepID=A0ABQ8CKK2_BRANA|nr:hypothetical protein HID58_025257 [Brassica napus]VDC96396.1 unnamed protein product [Brassica rapa]
MIAALANLIFSTVTFFMFLLSISSDLQDSRGSHLCLDQAGRAMKISDLILLTIGNVSEKGMPWLNQFLEEWPKVLDGFVEMVLTVVSGLWNNYKDSLYYVYRKLLE